MTSNNAPVTGVSDTAESAALVPSNPVLGLQIDKVHGVSGARYLQMNVLWCLAMAWPRGTLLWARLMQDQVPELVQAQKQSQAACEDYKVSAVCAVTRRSFHPQPHANGPL